MRTARGRGGVVVAIVAALALATLISPALWRLGPLAMLVALFLTADAGDVYRAECRAYEASPAPAPVAQAWPRTGQGTWMGATRRWLGPRRCA